MPYFITVVTGLVVSWTLCSSTYVRLRSTPWARGRKLLSLSRWLLSLLSDGQDQFWTVILDCTALLFAASCALHVIMVASSVSSCCRSKCSTVSLSISPSIIWSLMLFCADWSKQKLHVLVSSLRATRKSSKLSPVCCLRLLRLRRSTDSLIWPSMWHFIARMIVSTSCLCSTDRPRLLTIARVSLDKHKVSTCTFV